MEADYAYPHMAVKAEQHSVYGYAGVMGRRQSLANTLAANCKMVRGKRSQPKIVETAKARGYVIDQGTISRIERAKLTPSLDVLEALAAGLEIEPWQLLITNLNPRNPPILKGAGGTTEKELWKRLQDAAKQLGIAE